VLHLRESVRYGPPSGSSGTSIPKSGAHQLCRHPACPPADHQGGGGLV